MSKHYDAARELFRDARYGAALGVYGSIIRDLATLGLSMPCELHEALQNRKLAWQVIRDPSSILINEAIGKRVAKFDLDLSRALKKHPHSHAMPYLATLSRALTGTVRQWQSFDPKNIFEVKARWAENKITEKFMQALERDNSVIAFSDRDDLMQCAGISGESSAYRTAYCLRDKFNSDIPLATLLVAFDEDPEISFAEIRAGNNHVSDKPTVAIFYGVWTGMQTSVSPGSPLLFGAVEDIQRNHPDIRHFITRSPIPGFRAWIENITDQMLNNIGAARVVDFRERHKDEVLGAKNVKDIPSQLYCDLGRLAAHYILSGKWQKGKYSALDRLAAAFHRGNGAIPNGILLEADLSARGFKQSFSIMTTYVYLLDLCKQYVKAYQKGEPVRTPKMQNWLTPGNISPGIPSSAICNPCLG